jgi:ribosomal protein S18 acetylase RimI-like enzyme
MPTIPTIIRFADHTRSEHIRAGIDVVFFETAPLAPTTGPERAAFRHLWLGQYLRHEPNFCHIALGADGAVLGYLVGCLIDPSTSERFASLSYFSDFADACRRYPAHLHINVTAHARGRGLGARLVDAFAADVRAAGLPGLHVVTGSAQRNVRFYERIGFTRIATTTRRDGEVVFLGRPV